MATMREVAKKAGVSVATVSRVLNSNGYVNDETRKKVLETMDALKYKPNNVARSLFKKQTKTIGLIVPDITNPFFPQLARAVEDVTNEKGYTIILGNSDEKPEKEQRYLDILEQKYVDGIIMATNTLPIEHIKLLDKPIVVVDRAIHADVPTIVVQNRKGAKAAVNHLKGIGCQRIAHIKGPEHVDNANERCQGYLDIVGTEPWFTPEFVVDGNYTTKESYHAAVKLLRNHPEIDGIFAGNDLMATGVLKAAHELGISIPDELAVIGFDGIDMCETTHPELSTLAQPIYQIGEAAAELLIDLIEKKQISESFKEYPVDLIIRGSTKRT
ncbi:LacI family transcriptional regulator [Scopulibacillus darangshiensis]|uniref:LacI family transcriptional regulator n=1 Tax=Scopulibacillus darangshiensis TaxID=442528 RepID=A0A4R2NSU3_9BACL|nr:LacI family DNA-binding transcriptional regulator [Scopulibacillus darangshiensis]TCP24970.1 LacI family transcriptional regulator [Scopulibacillus darangshiensis]